MSWAHRAALGVGALVAMAGLALGVVAAIDHDSIRSDYEGQVALLEASDPRYDAARSDQLHDRTLSAAARAGDLGWLSALGWVVMALGFRPGPAAESTSATVTPGQVRAGVSIDACVIGSALALERTVPDWLGAAHAGFGALVGAQLVGLALAYGWGALCSGVSLGGLATGTRAVTRDGTAPGMGRGLGALVLLPFGVVSVALARWSIAPAHLAWVGVRLTATARGKR